MSEDITEKGKEIMTQITNAVESAGKEVVSQVSNLTDGQVSEMSQEATEAAIQKGVDTAINVLRIAGDKVREEGINAERVTLKAGVGIPNVAQLEISTDVPSKTEKNQGEGFAVQVDDAV